MEMTWGRRRRRRHYYFLSLFREGQLGGYFSSELVTMCFYKTKNLCV
jgi:hypothetical protein